MAGWCEKRRFETEGGASGGRLQSPFYDQHKGTQISLVGGGVIRIPARIRPTPRPLLMPAPSSHIALTSSTSRPSRSSFSPSPAFCASLEQPTFYPALDIEPPTRFLHQASPEQMAEMMVAMHSQCQYFKASTEHNPRDDSAFANW